jgi:hypothetical protein
MTPEQIEDNKSILEFMGYVVTDFEERQLRFNNPDFAHEKYYHWPLVESCNYYKSYNDLMPVWHKFRDLRFTDLIHEKMHSGLKEIVGRSILNKPIEKAFRQLADACKWANSTKQ